MVTFYVPTNQFLGYVHGEYLLAGSPVKATLQLQNVTFNNKICKDNTSSDNVACYAGMHMHEGQVTTSFK